MKGVVCPPKKILMTLNHIKKGKRERGVGKKIKNLSGLTATLRVILRERNLCDIDRILLKRRSSGIIQLDRLSFTHFWADAEGMDVT